MLASDVSHFYENMNSERPFTTAFHVGDMLVGYDKLRAAAPSAGHIVPGHDALVIKFYPASSSDLDGVAVRLAVSPSKGCSLLGGAQQEHQVLVLWPVAAIVQTPGVALWSRPNLFCQ